jgi:ABC-type methionine transport system permease subunit
VDAQLGVLGVLITYSLALGILYPSNIKTNYWQEKRSTCCIFIGDSDQYLALLHLILPVSPLIADNILGVGAESVVLVFATCLSLVESIYTLVHEHKSSFTEEERA